MSTTPSKPATPAPASEAEKKIAASTASWHAWLDALTTDIGNGNLSLPSVAALSGSSTAVASTTSTFDDVNPVYKDHAAKFSALYKTIKEALDKNRSKIPADGQKAFASFEKKMDEANAALKTIFAEKNPSQDTIAKVKETIDKQYLPPMENAKKKLEEQGFIKDVAPEADEIDPATGKKKTGVSWSWQNIAGRGIGAILGYILGSMFGGGFIGTFAGIGLAVAGFFLGGDTADKWFGNGSGSANAAAKPAPGAAPQQQVGGPQQAANTPATAPANGTYTNQQTAPQNPFYGDANGQQFTQQLYQQAGYMPPSGVTYTPDNYNPPPREHRHHGFLSAIFHPNRHAEEKLRDRLEYQNHSGSDYAPFPPEYHSGRAPSGIRADIRTGSTSIGFSDGYSPSGYIRTRF